MNVIICDDEQWFHTALTEYLEEWANANQTPLKLTSLYDPVALWKHVANDFNDERSILLLDIVFHDADVDGISLALRLREEGKHIPIIFVSSDQSRAVDGYLVEAIGYVTKPIDKERLFHFLDRAVTQMDSFIGFSDQGQEYVLRSDDILYAEIIDHRLTIYAPPNQYTPRMTIKEFLSLAEPFGFHRVQRAFVVNLKYVCKLRTTKPYSVTMKKNDTSVEIPVSRKNIEDLKFAHSNYLTRLL